MDRSLTHIAIKKISDPAEVPLELLLLADPSMDMISRYQGKGVGGRLLDHACSEASSKGYTSICIGTADTSHAQLRLYQKKGFIIAHTINNFFTDHYPEPIWENGQQAKHMIMLERTL